MKKQPSAIMCKACKQVFQPQQKGRLPWPCPSCGAKNPNLKRHYRSVAYLFMFGIFLNLLVVVFAFKRVPLNWAGLLMAIQVTMFLAAIIRIYSSPAPWGDVAAKALVWTSLTFTASVNLMLPIVLAGRIPIPHMVVYSVVFAYLIWLQWASSKCTAPASAPLPASPAT